MIYNITLEKQDLHVCFSQKNISGDYLKHLKFIHTYIPVYISFYLLTNIFYTNFIYLNRCVYNLLSIFLYIRLYVNIDTYRQTFCLKRRKKLCLFNHLQNCSNLQIKGVFVLRSKLRLNCQKFKFGLLIYSRIFDNLIHFQEPMW